MLDVIMRASAAASMAACIVFGLDLPALLAANHAPNRAMVIIILASHIMPNCVWMVSTRPDSSLDICSAITIMSDASTSSRPAPVSCMNLLWCSRSIADGSSPPSPRRLPLPASHTVIAATAAPTIMVWPTIPGSSAPASGRNSSSVGFSCDSSSGSIVAPPTPNRKTPGTRWPSTFESTFVETV